ncbi:hypothetical protein [Deinococcus carri]|uniref:hypothetical protein n=1 Tax=Deinococcus carri TaxID=1211323 RepID=UPI0031F18DC9
MKVPVVIQRIASPALAREQQAELRAVAALIPTHPAPQARVEQLEPRKRAS